MLMGPGIPSIDHSAVVRMLNGVGRSWGLAEIKGTVTTPGLFVSQGFGGIKIQMGQKELGSEKRQHTFFHFWVCNSHTQSSLGLPGSL